MLGLSQLYSNQHQSASFPSNPIKSNAYTKGVAFTFNGGDYVYVPQSYDITHRTPIKLFIWLHDGGAFSSNDVTNLVPGGLQDWIILCPGGYEGGDFGPDLSGSLSRIINSRAYIKTRFNISPNEIFLGGYGTGGEAAYWIMFNHADYFAGIIGLNVNPFQTNPWIDTADPIAINDANVNGWLFNIAQQYHDGDGNYDAGTLATQFGQVQADNYPTTLDEEVGDHTTSFPDFTPWYGQFIDAGWTANNEGTGESGGGVGPPPAFSPYSISGMHSYYYSEFCTHDAFTASAIQDQSGNGEVDLTPDPTAPLFTAADANFNGYPSFGANFERRQVSGTFHSAIFQPATYYMVLYFSGSNTTDDSVYWRSNKGNFTNSAGFYADNNNATNMQVKDNGKNISFGDIAAGTYIISHIYDSGGTSAFYINDSQNAVTPDGGDSNIDSNSNTRMSIGSFNAKEYYWAVALQYEGAHDATTRYQLMYWLGQKYGIGTT